jgi:hypothetical protein
MAVTAASTYVFKFRRVVPREHKVEHSNSLKELTDEQLDAAIEYEGDT